MTNPYGVASDVHCHSWSAFSTVDADGVNSRLRIILDELLRAAKVLKKRGGNRLIICGDLFHVRGSVKPSVMNPTYETFEQISKMGIDVDAIAGNHDLEGNDSDELGNAMQTLGAIRGFTPITSPRVNEQFAFFPWYAKLDHLRDAMFQKRPARNWTRSSTLR